MVRRGKGERETGQEDEARKREGERESISEPPLLACRALMNANHDPEAARSTCCFPVQIAYNFYCHGRNSSLMEARLISVLVLRPGRVPWRFVALSLALAPPFSLLHPCHRPLPLACRSPRGFSPPFPAFPRTSLTSLAVCDSDSPSCSRSSSINATGRYAGPICEEYDGILPALYR